MKFAHFADLHLGCWRDPEMNRLLLNAFDKALDDCISRGVDFILMSGDIFDTSMPSFEVLERSTKKLSHVRNADIPVYIIAGSHDFSPSGKTMLKVLENAGLVIDVGTHEEDDLGVVDLKFVKDPKTGTIISGLLGRAGSLEEGLYKKLDVNIPHDGFRIFMFHAGIEEFKPAYLSAVKAMPLDLLPEGFDYYAGGHIHVRSKKKYGSADLVFPGPLMPCNFKEFEVLKYGGYCITTVSPDSVKTETILLDEFPVTLINIDAEDKSPSEIESELDKGLDDIVDSSLVFVKVGGAMSKGSSTDIDFRSFMTRALERGAMIVKKNSSALMTQEYDESPIEHESLEGLEKRVIEKFIEGGATQETLGRIEELMNCFNLEKHEGETNNTFEERVYSAGDLFMKKKI
jgi:DNA repair protein SbcD/Mre11